MLLERGECASITELTAAEEIERSYLCRVLRLTLLAAEMVEAILGSAAAGGVTPAGLMGRPPAEAALLLRSG